MNRINNKTLMIIIGVLLVSNLILLGLYLNRELGRKKLGKSNRSPIDFMARELQLNDAQTSSFAKLWADNNERNKPIVDSIRSGREQLYQYLRTSPQPDSLIMSITEKIARFDRQLTLNNYAHFRKVSELCSSDQQVRLDSLLKKMGNKRALRRNQGGN
jgi:hypothetical protein